MSDPRSRREFLAFYFLSLALASLVIVVSMAFRLPDVLAGLRLFLAEHYLVPNAVTIARYALVQPWAWLILLFASAPTISAMVISASTGVFGLKRLLVRLRPIGTGADFGTAVNTYFIILGTSALVIGWYYWWGGRVGDARAVAFSRAALGGTPLWIGLMLAVGHLIDEGGALEELGWRGFALPRLVDSLGSPLSATVALGFFWWLWHFPREIPGLLAGTPVGPFVQGQVLFLGLCLALSVLCTWAWVRTGGSALPAILIHGGTNVWAKALGPTIAAWAGIDVRTVIVVALSLGAGAELIRRRAEPARTP
jgi:uncharacterized protein